MPCTCATSVLSVSNTTTFGESEVCRVMVLPARPLMMPWSFTDWAQATTLNEAINNNRAATVPRLVSLDLFIISPHRMANLHNVSIDCLGLSESHKERVFREMQLISEVRLSSH